MKHQTKKLMKHQMKEVDENFDLDEFEVEAEPEMGGDPADDMMADIEPVWHDEAQTRLT